MTSLTTVYYPPFPKHLCEGNVKNISLQIYTPNLKKASVCSTHCWCTISAQTEPPIPGSMFLLEKRKHIDSCLTFKSGASPLTQIDTEEEIIFTSPFVIRLKGTRTKAAA